MVLLAPKCVPLLLFIVLRMNISERQVEIGDTCK